MENFGKTEGGGKNTHLSKKQSEEAGTNIGKFSRRDFLRLAGVGVVAALIDKSITHKKMKTNEKWPENNGLRIPKYRVEDSKKIPEWILNEAYLINEGLDKKVINKTEAQEGLIEDKEILNLMRGLVDIKYFVEYPPESLEGKDRGEALLKLFNQEFTDSSGKKQTLVDYLSENHQAISLAMSSLDDSTAKAVKFLNEKNVPVVGWVVVDDAEGYWTNPTNIEATKLKTEQIKEWAKQHGLKISTIGFDLEKPLEFIKAVAKKNIIETAKEIRKYRKAAKEQETLHGDSTANLSGYIEQLKREGFKTEIYDMPGFAKPMLGCMDVKNADTTYEMLYTSDFPRALQKRAVHMMKSKGTSPAMGIVTGKEGETPGREFTKGVLPNHLSEEDLEKNIEALLDVELDFGKRKFTLRNFYLFALNDAKVAMMLEKAMDKAFDSRLEK